MNNKHAHVTENIMKFTSLCLFFLISTSSLAADFQAHVLHIADGDTITILNERGMQERLRLDRIDAPETTQAYGTESKQALTALVLGKDIIFTPKTTDRYGRTLAEVKLPSGQSVNEELVRLGAAWWYNQYAPDDKTMEALEEKARAEHLGLWTQADAIPPWHWRKGIGVTGYIGNSRTKTYYLRNCHITATFLSSNKVEFPTEAEAQKAGYQQGGGCK